METHDELNARFTEFCMNFKTQYERWPTMKEVGAGMGLNTVRFENLSSITVIPTEHKKPSNDDTTELIIRSEP